MTIQVIVCGFGLGMICFLVGCGSPVSTRVEGAASEMASASPYRLAEPPTVERESGQPFSLTEAKALCVEQNEAGGSGKEFDLTLVGKIDAGEFRAFEEGRAVFMLSELPAAGHGEGDPDHADNCPFCKRRAANAPKAIVEIVDASGKVIERDASKLLGLSEGDRIVASGGARYDSGVNMLTIRCTQVYSGP